MIRHLLIHNLAIVHHVEIDLNPGMTVITGETGAGKSILLDALGLVLGDKAHPDLVRPGCDKAEVCATFDVSSLPGALLFLSDLELNGQDEQECIVRRVIFSSGRTRAYINGRPAVSRQLKILGEHLLQIHGQHQHHLLLNPSEQLRLLDAFGQLDPLLATVKKSFTHWAKLKRDKEKLSGEESQFSTRLELLAFQIQELRECHLQEGEIESLNQSQTQLANAQSYLSLFEELYYLLKGADHSSILFSLQKGLKQIEPYLEKDQQLTSLHSFLTQAEIQLQEAICEVSSLQNAIEIDPEKLHSVEQRLSKLFNLARKHKVAPEQLLNHLHRLEKELTQLNQMKKKLDTIDQSILEAYAQYQQQANTLSQARKKAAKRLSKKVTEHIGFLGLHGGLFEIELIEDSKLGPSLTGNEQAQFCVTANPGHPPRPLNKVASGGELSRISLAIQCVAAQMVHTPTLVFDEVDVGIGGKIGAVVGKALKALGTTNQVLCVTHLPQVASQGTFHLKVEKRQNKTQTKTEIFNLDEQLRIEEIARMLSDLEVSKQARAQAKKMLEIE